MWRHTLFFFLGISLLCGIPKDALGEGDDQGVETLTEGEPTHEQVDNANALKAPTAETATSAGTTLGGLASSSTSLLDSNVPQQIQSVAKTTEKMNATIDQIKAEKGIKVEQALAIKLLGKAAFLASFNKAASQNKRPTMQEEQREPAQVIRSGGFEVPNSPQDVNITRIPASVSAPTSQISSAAANHPEIVNMTEAMNPLPNAIITTQGFPQNNPIDDKRSLQFNEAITNGAYQADFSKNKMDSGTVAVLGQLTGSHPPVNALQEAGSKSEKSEKFKKIVEDFISKKRAELTSKKPTSGMAQNFRSDDSPDSTQSLLNAALEKATKVGFSVLKSTGLLFDFGEEPSRGIASTTSAGGGADAEMRSEEGPSGLFQLFSLFSGLLLAAAIYYVINRKKRPEPPHGSITQPGESFLVRFGADNRTLITERRSDTGKLIEVMGKVEENSVISGANLDQKVRDVFGITNPLDRFEWIKGRLVKTGNADQMLISTQISEADRKAS